MGFFHQRRIHRAAIEQGSDALIRDRGAIAGCLSFFEILQTVGQALSPIFGLGELYLYDTAQRIGAFLGLFPQRVHLHAGVRKGAKTLGLVCARPSIGKEEFPEALQALPPHEIEDFLCIFKSRLRPEMNHRR